MVRKNIQSRLGIRGDRMRTLEEINKGCKNCTMPEILLCKKCMKEFKEVVNDLYGLR